MAAILKAALAYFGLVFGAAFALGALRVLWVAPRIGARPAELIEMPIMLAVVVASASWLVRRLRRPASVAGWTRAGWLACALILAADFTLAVYVRGLPLDRYLSGLDPVTAVPYYAILGLCGVMPALLYRARLKRGLA